MISWPSTDWPSLLPMVDAGLLPNLKAIIEGGTIAALATSAPLTREALMTSLVTGLRADRHGVLMWRALPFWDLLEQAGVKTAVVNWPATAPGARGPGIRVDDLFATPTGVDFDVWAMPLHSVAPPELAETLAQLRVHPADDLSGYLRLFAPHADPADPACQTGLRKLAQCLARAATVQAAATHIAEHCDWDVLCLDCELIHRIKLDFATAEPDGPFGDVMAQAHVLQDLMLGRLVALAGAGATVIVVSPNGLSFLPDGTVQVLSRGMLAVAGPEIEADIALPGARLIDVAPSLLARYGLGVEADGRVLAALAPSGRRLRPVEVMLPQPVPAWDPAAQLLALGYQDRLSATQVKAMQNAQQITLLNLGIALMDSGRLTEAAEVLERARAMQPTDMHVLRRLASCRAMMADYAACRTLGQTMLAIDPTQPWGHLLMGTWAVLGEPQGEDAQRYIVSARELGADSPYALIRLGGLELARRNLAAAMDDFATALALDPHSAEAAYGLAVARQQNGDPVGAEAAWRTAIRLEHHQPLAHLQLGLLLRELGRLPEAIRAFETALAQGSDAIITQNALDRARAMLGHHLSRTALSSTALSHTALAATTPDEPA